MSVGDRVPAAASRALRITNNWCGYAAPVVGVNRRRNAYTKSSAVRGMPSDQVASLLRANVCRKPSSEMLWSAATPNVTFPFASRVVSPTNMSRRIVTSEVNAANAGSREVGSAPFPLCSTREDMASAAHQPSRDATVAPPRSLRKQRRVLLRACSGSLTAASAYTQWLALSNRRAKTRRSGGCGHRKPHSLLRRPLNLAWATSRVRHTWVAAIALWHVQGTPDQSRVWSESIRRMADTRHTSLVRGPS